MRFIYTSLRKMRPERRTRMYLWLGGEKTTWEYIGYGRSVPSLPVGAFFSSIVALRQRAFRY